MKFRALLRDVHAFLTICAAVRSFSKKALLKLHRQLIRLIAVPHDGCDGAQLWTSCSTDALFADFRIESRYDDTIYCELPDIGQLHFALKSAERGASCVLKLVKSGNRQLLSVAVQGSQSSHDALHEVPVRVLTELEIAQIVAPALEADVAEVYLPPLVEIQSFLGCAADAGCSTCSLRLCPPATAGGLLSDAEGVLSLTAEGSYSSTFESHYIGVKFPPGVVLPSHPIEVVVDLKRLCRFTAVRDVSPTSISAHLANRRALVLSAYSTTIKLVYYIPALHQ